MYLSKEDLQAIAQEISRCQNKNTNERARALNREGVKNGGGKKSRISNKPTIAAVAKSLVVVGVFLFWGLVFGGLCHYLAPYL